MNELILLLLGIVAVFSLASSVALLQMGVMIDRYPVEGEERRQKGLASPVESTKISVLIFWALFGIGAFALFQEGKYMLILGITTIVAIVLFMMTALIFSFVVFSLLRKRKKSSDVFPVIMTENTGVQTPIPIMAPTPLPPAETTARRAASQHSISEAAPGRD